MLINAASITGIVHDETWMEQNLATEEQLENENDNESLGSSKSQRSQSLLTFDDLPKKIPKPPLPSSKSQELLRDLVSFSSFL